MNNNANLQEAYRNQLYNQLSLVQLERNARDELLNFGNERSDDDDRHGILCRRCTFLTMAVMAQWMKVLIVEMIMTLAFIASIKTR